MRLYKQYPRHVVMRTMIERERIYPKCYTSPLLSFSRASFFNDFKLEPCCTLATLEFMLSCAESEFHSLSILSSKSILSCTSLEFHS